jgi:hypothetical protein
MRSLSFSDGSSAAARGGKWLLGDRTQCHDAIQGKLVVQSKGHDKLKSNRVAN